MATTNFSKVK